MKFLPDRWNSMSEQPSKCGEEQLSIFKITSHVCEHDGSKSQFHDEKAAGLKRLAPSIRHDRQSKPVFQHQPPSVMDIMVRTQEA